VASVRAVALRNAGWTAKAATKNEEAVSAALDSQLPAFKSLVSVDFDQIPASLHSWCLKNMPDVKSEPVPRKPAPRPKPKPAPEPRKTTERAEPAEPDEPKTDPRFDTCREANAHGYQDYRQGIDPEYDWYQDRDDDGVVCEPR
jgi:hypothetical protein